MALGIFSLPMEFDRTDSCLNVLKFNPTGDLLATGGSDCTLTVFSFSRNSYIVRKTFSSPITAIEWKSDRKYFGIVGLFLGLHDGSIHFLTFPAGDSSVRQTFSPFGVLIIPFQFAINCHLVQIAGQSEPITHLAYHEEIFISFSGDDAVFWSDNLHCGKYLTSPDEKLFNGWQICGRGNGLWL